MTRDLHHEGPHSDLPEWPGMSLGEDEPRRVSTAEAAELLCREGGLMGLTAAEATRVIGYMQPKRVAPGVSFIRQGERESNHFLALVLHGTVRVNDVRAQDPAQEVLGIFGPGSVMGDLSLVDGGPRSATCVAVGYVGLAILTRDALNDMIRKEPKIAARLMVVLMQRMAKRFREIDTKAKVLAHINVCLSRELEENALEVPSAASEASTGFPKTQPPVI